MGETRKLRPGTLVMAGGGAIALFLYLWFLSLNFAGRNGPGDSVVAQAYATLTALAALWGVLLVLVAADRIIAGPSWTRRAGFILAPVAAIATAFATDYPGNSLCLLSVAALPPAVGAYALLGGLPVLHGKAWARGAQAFMLLLTAALSAYPIERFLS